MTSLDVVREKVRRIREAADALARTLPPDPTTLAQDGDRRDLVAFRFYLGMQHAIDLASHVLADEGWGPAPDLRSHFAILAQRAVLDGTLAQSLADGVKIRNLVGHAYAAIDPVKLHAAAGLLPALLDRYCAALLTFAERR